MGPSAVYEIGPRCPVHRRFTSSVSKSHVAAGFRYIHNSYVYWSKFNKKFCACHSCTAAEACTKFCQEQIIIFQVGTNSNLNKLVFWAHKLHAERFPGSAYSSATKQLNTKSYTNKNAIDTCQNKCIGYIKINLNATNWKLTPVSVTIAGMSLFKNNAWQIHRFIRQEWVRAWLHCSWNGCKWLDGYVTSGHLQEQWCGWLYPLTLKHGPEHRTWIT